MSNTLTRREDISFPIRAIQAAFPLPPMTRQAAALLGAAARSLVAVLKTWSESRKLQALPDGMLKDIGVSRGAVYRAVRHGRDTDLP